MNQRITTVLLDWGGVVAPEDALPVAEGVYGAAPDDIEAHRIFGRSTRALALAQMNEDDIKQALEAYGLTIPNDYRERWHWNVINHLYPAPAMLELINDLRQNHYGVSLLSNVWPLSCQIIREQGWYDDFDHVFLSCDMKMAKPDGNIYDSALNTLGVAPETVLFVDDKEVNLVYPSELGMQTLLIRGPELAASAIREKLGL